MITTLVESSGLARRYLIRLPAATIKAERDARLAEIAGTASMPGFPVGRAPMELVARRYGAAVLAELIERRVRDGVAAMIEAQALRPAQKPAVSIGPYSEGRDLDVTVAIEVLPDMPVRALDGIALERLRAEPSPADVELALASLGERHGVLEDIAARPAAPGDVLVCDMTGRLPLDLLPNGLGRGARAGVPGLPPTRWSVDCSEGMATEIIATATQAGLPWFDLALRGEARKGGHLRVFLSTATCLPVVANDELTLCLAVRLVEGSLPDGALARVGFNERSTDQLLRTSRSECQLDLDEVCSALEIGPDPRVAYARPLFEIAFLQAAPVDLRLRFGPARVFPGHQEPTGVIFPGGEPATMEIRVGGNQVAPGFAAQLEGLAPGETRTIRLAFPPDHPVPEVASLRAHYTVTARALKRRLAAKLDDALAKRLNLPDLAALRDAVRKRLLRHCAEMSRLRLKQAVLEAVGEACGTALPEGLIAAEFGEIWQRVRSEQSAGRADPADTGKDEEQLRAEYRAIAAQRVGARLFLAEIARTEGVAVSEAELAGAIRREGARHHGQEREVFEYYRTNREALAMLRAPLIEEKVIDLLVSRAVVTERHVTMAELMGTK